MVKNSLQKITSQSLINKDVFNTDKKEPLNETTKLLFVGDFMADRGVLSSVKRNFDGDFAKLFIHIQEYFDASDIVFLNLEGPISDKGKNVGSIYSFRMNPLVADALADAGVSIVSFANNHVGDWGVQAFVDTLVRLESVGIQFVGAGRNDAEAINLTITTNSISSVSTTD